jgi:hypothetical protein
MGSSRGAADSGCGSMAALIPGVCCVPSLGSNCPSGQICCGSRGGDGGGSTTNCVSAMSCPGGQNQLCAKDSDCLEAGMTCQMITIMGASVGVCVPGGADGGRDGGDGGSSSGGEAGPMDAAVERG